MAVTYDGLVSDLANALPISTADANFLAILPQAVAYSEARIQNDLDFLSSFTAFSTVNMTQGNRLMTLPAGLDVLQEINVITPLLADTSTGTRNQVIPVSKEFLNATYVSPTNPGVPQYFAMLSDESVILGPYPDASYKAECIGTMKYPLLSSSNQTNWLYTNIQPLYFAACMIFMSGYQKNFGEQSDDPKMAQSWETQYGILLNGYQSTEARKKMQASAWTSLSTAILATPGR